MPRQEVHPVQGVCEAAPVEVVVDYADAPDNGRQVLHRSSSASIATALGLLAIATARPARTRVSQREPAVDT